MNKNIIERVAWAYARVRTKTSPFLWHLFYWRPWTSKERVAAAKNVYDEFLASDMDDAERILSNYPYRWEYLGGLVDASIPVNKGYRFFLETKRGRDCDDIARMWTIWGTHNNYNAKEWIHVTYEHPFKEAHVIITLSRLGQHWYMDKWARGPYNTLEKALDRFTENRGEGKLIEYEWYKE